MCATNDGHLPVTRLMLSYPLPEGSRVKGFGSEEIQKVMAVCSMTDDDTFTVSYTLVSDCLGVLPCGSFPDGDISDASKIPVDALEIVIRARIEEGLKNYEPETLHWNPNQPLLEYCLPPMRRGEDIVHVKVECYWPEPRKYFVVLHLMHGRTDLGIIGARRLRGVAINFPELCTRVGYMAEALMPDDLETLADQLLDKQDVQEDG